MKFLSASLLLVFVLACTDAAPISTTKRCAKKCDELRNLLNYKIGKKYVYDFKNRIISDVPQGTTERVQIELTAKAEFHIIGKCEVVLTLSGVSMKEKLLKDGAETESRSLTNLPKQLQKNALSFGFNAGRVTNLCPNPKEERKPLNVKRAIVSQFQISMEHLETPTSLTERDVSGDCLTQYRFKGRSSNNIQIEKTKSILGCANRKMSYSDLQGQSFDRPTETSQMPLLKGSLNCALQVSLERHLVSSECKESQVFRPFSGKESGATISVTQSLSLNTISESTIKAPEIAADSFTDLLLEHSPDGYRDFRAEDDTQTAEGVLKQTCIDIQKDKLSSSKVIAGNFPKLVRYLRDLDSKGLKTLQGKVGTSICKKDKKTAMGVFQDAIPMVRTPQAIIFMLDELSGGKSTEYRRSWLFSLATVREPTTEMIQKLNNIGGKLNNPLVSSSLVATYCKVNEMCDEEDAVKSIVKRITSDLGNDCSGDKTKVLLALRAIGNLGFASNWKVLYNCIRNTKISMSVRVSAVQAMRKVRCESSGWDEVDLMKIFQLPTEDPELRINAYLSLITCSARPGVLKGIIRQLEDENCQQIGSFVWTHLSNILETSQVFRQALRESLRKFKFIPGTYAKKFNLDYRKYSRNYEKSYFYEPLNSGLSSEVNVIFSTDSFVPRAVSVNFTAGLFGKSISLIEFGARGNNVDQLFRAAYQSTKQTKGDGSKMIHFNIDQFKQKTFGKQISKPSADLYLRMFGNELAFVSDLGLDALILGSNTAAKMSRIGQALNNMKFENTRMMMEAVVSVPTISGFPIELSLDLASSVRVSGGVQMGAKDGATSVMASYDPSGAIGLVGRMRLNAQDTEIGIEFHGMMYRNFKMGGQLTFTQNEVTLLMDAPQEKATVIDMTSQMFLIHKRSQRPQPMKAKRSEFNLCNTKRSQTVLGLKLCLNANYANNSEIANGPSFPFTGDNQLNIAITPLAKVARFKLRGKYVSTPNTLMGVQSLEMEMNAVGSKDDRQLLFAFNDNTKGMNVDMSLKMFSPIKKMEIAAKGDLSKPEIDASLKVDKKSLLQLTTKQKIEGNRRITTIVLDADKKPKLIEATLSSDTSLKINERDHIFEFKSQQFFIRFLKVTVFKKVSDDLAITSKYGFDIAGAERSAQGNFVLNLKEDASDGNVGFSIKKGSAVQFGWKNEFSVKTVPDKSLNGGQNVVTEHTINFSNTLDFKKFDLFIDRKGVLVIQHDFSPDMPEASRFLYYDLKVNDLKHGTTFRLSQTQNPFSLVFNTFLSSKELKLDYDNKLKVAVSGWKAIRISDTFMRGKQTYSLLVENTINPEKVVQEAKVVFPKRTYHLLSSFMAEGETVYQHKLRVAWGPKRSYELKSTIDWGTPIELQACRLFYQVNSTALQDGQRLGNFYVNSCPNLKDRALSLEAQVSDKSRVIGLFRGDVVFKTMPTDFHIGGSAETDIPGIINFVFRTNHIYANKLKSAKAELTSHIMATYKWKGSKDPQTYGYELTGTGTEQGFDGKVNLHYVYSPIGQLKSTYEAKVTIKKWSVEESTVETQLKVTSSMVGKAGITVTGTVRQSKDSVSVTCNSVFDGKLSLISAYKFDGNQRVNLKYNPGDKLKVDEKFILNVKDEDTSKSWAYKYNYRFDASNLDDPLQLGMKLDFNSNFALQKLTFKSRSKFITNQKGGFKYDSKDLLVWTFSGQEGNFDWAMQAESKADSFSAMSKMSSSYEQLKLLKFTVKVIQNPNEPSLKIDGRYNDRQADLTIGAKYAEKPAGSLEDNPDFQFIVALKGDIPYARDGKLTVRTYYQEFKFIQFDTTIVHMGPQKSKIFLNGGMSMADMLAKVELGASTPFGTPEFNMKIGVIGKTDSSLEPLGPISQRLVLISEAEASFILGSLVEIKFLVNQQNSKKGTQFVSESVMRIGGASYIPKGTKLILSFNGNDLIANSGKLFFEQKSKAVFETFEQTFDYDFSEKLTFKTQTNYKLRKVFFVAFDWPKGEDQKKSVEFYFKPTANTAGFILDYKVSFISTALNFDSSLLLRVPKLVGKVDLKVSLFQSLKDETKKTDLLDNAAKAFSVSLSTSMKQLTEFQLKAAMSKDMKGQLALKVVTEKTLDFKVVADLSNLAKITGSVEVNGKKVEITLEQKGDDTKLTVKGNGNKIGEANMSYKAGQSLDANLDATSPTGQTIVLKVKHEHPNGKWDWRQWSHKSSVDISKDGKRIFGGKQDLSFQFESSKKESTFTANFETSVEAFQSLKTSGSVGWSDGLRTKLDVDFKGVANSRLTIRHKVQNWQRFYVSAMNKIDFSGTPSNFRLILNSECNPNPLVTFEIAGNVIPSVSLFHVSSNEKYVIKFMSKSVIGDINFETNILTGETAKELYIRGDVASYGKVALVFAFLGDQKYKLKMEFGKQFITLYPTLMVKSTTLPFDASINVKIETSFEQMLSGNVEVVQKVGDEYLSSEHKTEIVINGSPYIAVTAGYDVLQDDKTGKLTIERQSNALKAELSYNPTTSVYKHNVMVKRKALGNRPLFESIADCSSYDLKADVAKCYLSAMYGRTKMVFEVANNVQGGKVTKSLKLAWNDLRRQFVKFLFEQTPLEKSDTMSLTFQAPIRSYRIQRTLDLSTDSLTELKLSTLTPDLKKTDGFVYVFMQYKPTETRDYEYTVRVQSSLLKKDIKTVVNYAIDKDEKLTITADMYIDKSTPSLSMTFTIAGYPEKRDLELKLTGGDRYLNMFLSFDVTDPVKKLKVGARAKDWKRELSVLYEPYRMLETVVDTGKNKQTVKWITEPMQQNNNGYRHTLVVDYPEVKGFLKIMLQLNRSPLSILAIVQRDKAKPEDQLVFNGRFMNSRNILMEIKRIIGSNQITDAYTQVTLSADKIIETSLKWRPAVFSDAKNFLLNELAPTKMNQYLKNRGEGLLEVLQRVGNAVAAPIKANIKIPAVIDAAQAAVTDFMKVKNGIVSTLKSFRFVFSELRLSKLLETIMQVSDQINTYLGMMFEGISKSKGLPINLDFQKSYAAVKMQYQMIYEGLKEYTKDWNDAIIIQFLSNARGVITKSVQSFNAWLDQATKVAKKWAAKRDKLMKMMRKRFGSSMSTTSGYIQAIQAWMKKLQGTITGAIVEKLFSQEDLKEWAEMADKLRILNNWIRSSLSGSKKYSDLQLSMQFLRNGDLKQAFVTYFKPEKNKILTWSLKQGFASWQIYFPYDIKSLQTVPAAILSYTQSKLRSTVKEIRQGSFALGKYYLRLNELIFRFSLNEALRRQLPPFKASAWISGSQHFVTFDGVNVEHSGGCTYLLAHDFVNHGFSILGEYANKKGVIMRKNLIVQTNQAAVYISPQGEVKVRNSKGEQPQSKMAPFAAGDLFVSRWGSVLSVKGPNDLQIRCFLDLDVCRLTVSPWSHAHINGFLGSNDYEKCNDVYNAYENNEYPFCLHADMWKVGKCKAKNFAVTHDSYSRDSAAYRNCSIFDRASLFSRCFSKVDPSSYLRSCMNTHQLSMTVANVHVCRVFLMYVSRCRAEGIILQMPRNCMTCGKPNRKDWMMYRRPFTIQQKFKKNFVFIFEAKPCIKQISNVFKELVKKILSRKEDDTYNLITFGGDGNFRNPTLHMLGKTKTRGNKDDLEKGLNQVLLNGKDSVDDGEVATKAVQMALGQNDDVTSATVVVLISCSKCKESAKYQYTNMQRRFSKRGIRFHYFIPHDFGSDGKSKVAGFASPNAFNEKGSRIARKLLARIQQPRDTCSALARSTSGSSWDINTLLKMKGAARGSMLKNALKKQHQNKRVCSCTGSVNNDDVIQCKDRK